MNRHARRAQGRIVERDVLPGPDTTDGEPAAMEVMSLPPHAAGCTCGGGNEEGVVRFRMKGESTVLIAEYSVATARKVLSALLTAIARAEGKPMS